MITLYWQAEFFFDDIELYELDVLSPPPPSPPPPPNVLLWLDGEGGPNGVQVPRSWAPIHTQYICCAVLTGSVVM